MSSYDVALESYKLFREAGADHLTACAWLGNEDGETSFRIGVWGDHHTAFDPAQHHQARRDALALPPPKGAGINVLTASHADQIRAIIWEMKQSRVYRHVWPALLAAATMADKIAALLIDFEQADPRRRAIDLARRTALGNYWLGQIPDETPKAAVDHDAIDGCACGIEHDGHTPDHELPSPRSHA